jgi:hypothetical protein
MTLSENRERLRIKSSGKLSGIMLYREKQARLIPSRFRRCKQEVIRLRRLAI